MSANNQGITLVAIIVTLIVLLILAGVSLSSLFSEKGLFGRAENASNRYNEAKALEVLETVLLTDGQMEKQTNPKYNQDDFLDDLIKKEIEGSDIKGDVAIIGEYAYELDRSVPKIGRYLGIAKDLVFPTVTASEPILANDYRTASFEVTAIEEKKGINKIEIWFAGERIETLTKTYSNVKTEIKETFTVNKNGVYTIKAYGDLMASVAVEVTGIVPAVEFSPNGNTEWKKEHTTKITVKETGERVTSLKYKWTESGANEPAVSEFTENCPADNTIIGKDMTGTYYLWILLTTETGKTNICGSKGFNFDNEAPTVELISTPVSETSYTLTVTASDIVSGIETYEFYIEGEKVEPQTISDGTATYTWNGTEMQEAKECYVVVTDKAKNISTAIGSVRTKLHHWTKSTLVSPEKWELVEGGRDSTGYTNSQWKSTWGTSMPKFDSTTGIFENLPNVCDNSFYNVGKYFLLDNRKVGIYESSSRYGSTGLTSLTASKTWHTQKVADAVWSPEINLYSSSRSAYVEGNDGINNIIYKGIE